MKYYTRPLDVAITEVLALSEDGSYSLHLSTDKNQHDGDGFFGPYWPDESWTPVTQRQAEEALGFTFEE
jgi:hypothetical protein